MGRHSAPAPPSKIRPSLMVGLGFVSGFTGLMPSSPTETAPTTQLVSLPVKLVHSDHSIPAPVKVSSIKSSSRVVTVAKRYVGKNMPYRYGGNSPKTGIDCSHFVYRVFREAGYNIPYRSSYALVKAAKRTSDPRQGDLVLYRGHVGIYVGNGMMIHHGKSGGAFLVKVYKSHNFIGYGRIV